ncbi:MAG: sulfate ABC transporter permease subunit CysT [Candidatus Margulisbacteria bacterium]|nr:sulfate ABC transporter permease subunit CysT [Candidatus Margulisiibacteriota bacterium]
MQNKSKRRTILPGFGLSLGYTMMYLGLVVIVPLSMLFFKTSSMGFSAFWEATTAPRTLASYKLSFGVSFLSALINAFFGFIVAWVLVRYEFPFKKIINVLIDLPFALPTAVAGIALATLYSPSGWIGQFFEKVGIQSAYSPLGIVIALTFIGLPFVVRTVQPVLESIEMELEEAAASLGANRWQTFRSVLFPVLFPSLLTGFTLAFSRALGEYGSVVFISGNMPFKTEIPPLLIMTKLEQYDYEGAAAIAIVMLLASLVLLLTINLLNRHVSRRVNDELA